MYTICSLQNPSGYPLTDQGHWGDVISHLIYGENPAAHHFGLGGNKVREHQTGTITQHEAVGNVESLIRKERERERDGEREAVLQSPSPYLTWKCFVLPGVSETGTFLPLKMVLMVELLPTLG